MVKVVAIIPARSGSKGIPDKNIKLLAGFPLIAYSIAVARLVDNVDRIIVSTDSELYANIARKYGGEVPFLRPAEISGDDSTDCDFIKHALDWMQDNEGYQPDYLLHLRPTTPLREVNYIEAAIDRIKKTYCATALRSVHEMSESAYKAFEVDGEYLKPISSNSYNLDIYNNPRQSFEKTYQANGYVDVIKTAYVIENNKLHGDRVIAFVTPRVVEIDTMEDFDYLEYQVTKKPAILKKLFGK
ncbi:acylneuraminate cytidylyltransferase family protein [Patescibacteria group bacterium]|nr:acylneuraminate cytidylyltransferase family protein [Desulfobacteraceae bacterium]MBU4027168.1 acylneuraminate cytidylyltransferase family protein [Patescibacteria group bacterium]MBU4069284.1 acylneuraminate cytidylyltransferase family protein [Pseudomonadota bacterium]